MDYKGYQDVDYQDVLEEHPNHKLSHAADSDNLDRVRQLLQSEVNTLGELNYVLRWACREGHLDIVKYLVKEKEINIHQDYDYPLRYAGIYGHLDVVKYLVEQGANIHAYQNDALRWASRGGYLDIVKYLVEQDGDIHALNDLALIWAFNKNHLDIVIFLLSLESKMYWLTHQKEEVREIYKEYMNDSIGL